MLDLLRLNIQMFADDSTGGGTDPNGDPAAAGEAGTSGHMIPKFRFDEVSKKAKEYEATISELSGKVETLAEKEAKIAELEEQIASIEAKYKEEKITAKKIAVIKKKIGNRVVDMDLLLTLLDMDSIVVNKEGKIKGLSDQVKALQKSKPYLWKKASVVVTPGASGKVKADKTFAQKLAEKKVATKATIRKGKNYF